MFKCQKCNSFSQPREKSNVLVVETRSKTYFEMVNSVDEEGNNIKTQGKEQGQGLEIVKEIKVCGRCA